MPTASTETVRTDGVTLVETRVTATERHRVRLAVRCDGPVWPPRDAGPDVRWTDGTVTVEVATAKGVGFATSAAPASVDVELVAAACIYTAAREAAYELTQAEVSDVAGVSAVTIRNSYQELRD